MNIDKVLKSIFFQKKFRVGEVGICQIFRVGEMGISKFCYSRLNGNSFFWSVGELGTTIPVVLA